jgi:hypothetical protein
MKFSILCVFIPILWGYHVHFYSPSHNPVVL